MIAFTAEKSSVIACENQSPSAQVDHPSIDILLIRLYSEIEYENYGNYAYVNGETRDPDAVFGGVFQLYFSKDGKCTMSIDQKSAVVDWTLTDDGVTLTGDDTYPITFPDESRTTMTATIQGVDVLLEKYEG